MAHQLAGARFGRCEGDGHILVRLIGTCARAHKGSKDGDVAQREKAGFCPCCA